MALDEKKAWVLWPEYFDSSRSRDEGRKVAKDISVADPSLDMLTSAVKSLGVQYKVEADKSYPGNWHHKKGRVLVEKAMPKSLLVLKVAQYMRRSQRS
ncbi:MAG TPA: signal recognition particle subunit SRP19/SEC65 family protein [Methanomassiliicoccales archaeon]|nr:signal recognition particle subunit SRP19/SEC65 family protein [Methanomassiliicoccales archaeon]